MVNIFHSPQEWLGESALFQMEAKLKIIIIKSYLTLAYLVRLFHSFAGTSPHTDNTGNSILRIYNYFASEF